MLAVGTSLYFTVDDATSGRSELWSLGSSGTPTLLQSFSSGTGTANPTNLTNVNGTLYFKANSGTAFELWRSDGTTTGTVAVTTFPNNITNFANLTNVNGKLYFTADNGDTSLSAAGNEIWVLQ